MKAIEAAEHSPCILASLGNGLYHFFIERNSEWYDANGNEVSLQEFTSEFIPLVPERTCKIGDRVTFIEALNSGMCFKIGKSTAKIQNNRCYFWATDHWSYVGWGLNEVLDETCTLCEDPSVPPKPTLESLPAWTRCKVKPVNFPTDIYDVIKKPTGGLMYYRSGKDFEWSNVKLTSIYNPKTEQWECV